MRVKIPVPYRSDRLPHSYRPASIKKITVYVGVLRITLRSGSQIVA